MIDFDFSRDYILENNRAKLIPLNENHFLDLLPFSIHETDIWKYSLQQPIGEEKLKQYIKNTLLKRSAQKEYAFAVYDKKSQTFAGSTRFYDIDFDNESLEIGYTWYGKNFQGTGLNKNCKFLLLEFAFENLQMERVGFQADNNNAKSIAAMKSIGCTLEGVLRGYSKKPDGDRRDSAVLSILQSEWFKTVKEMLLKKI